MKRTGRRKEGFTLIEVVVSIAILGLVSIPFCNSLMVGYRSATSADSLLNSHLEATSIVEELMADGISVTEYTETTDDATTKIAVNDIVIDKSNTNYSGSISSTAETITETDENGTETTVYTGNYSNTITCSYTDNGVTYAYTASFDSTENYSDSSPSIYPCTYTDSDDETHDGICFLISDSTEEDTDVTACTFIMNFNCEFTEVTYDTNGNMVVEEDDDVLTLVFAPNSEYPAAEEDSTGSGSTGSGSTGSGSTGSDSTGSDSTGSDSTGSDSTGSDSTGSDSTGSDSTDEGPYWYDVAVSQGNVRINTSIRLADQDEDTEDTNISVTITDAEGNTATGTYYASQGIFIPSDSSTSYTVNENDGTVTLTDGSGNSTTYTVAESDDGSQTWTAASS